MKNRKNVDPRLQKSKINFVPQNVTKSQYNQIQRRRNTTVTIPIIEQNSEGLLGKLSHEFANSSIPITTNRYEFYIVPTEVKKENNELHIVTDLYIQTLEDRIKVAHHLAIYFYLNTDENGKEQIDKVHYQTHQTYFYIHCPLATLQNIVLFLKSFANKRFATWNA